MELINIPASISNLDQMNKLQSRENDTPLNYHLKNEEAQMKETAERLQKPEELEKAEHEKIDEKKRRKGKHHSKKGDGFQEEAREEESVPEHRHNRGSSSGKFIDYSA